MTVIKPEDTESFWREFSEYNALVNSEYRPIQPLVKKATSKIQEIWKEDPMRDQIVQNLEIFGIFEPAAIANLIRETSPGKKEAGLQAIHRFVKDLKP